MFEGYPPSPGLHGRLGTSSAVESKPKNPAPSRSIVNSIVFFSAVCNIRLVGTHIPRAIDLDPIEGTMANNPLVSAWIRIYGPHIGIRICTDSHYVMLGSPNDRRRTAG